MRKESRYASWLVTCAKIEDADKLRQQFPSLISPDAVIQMSVRGLAGEDTMPQVRQYRLGDYFAAIRVLSTPGDSLTTIRLLFHRRLDAGRFWKDLMAIVLGDLRRICPTVTIALEYKGEEAPIELAESHG